MRGVMNIKEWRALKKNLPKLPPEQRLRFLVSFMKKEKNAVVVKELQAMLKHTQNLVDVQKIWKQTATPRLSSRLLEQIERASRRPVQEGSSLETAVQQAPSPPPSQNMKQHDYFSGGAAEYTTMKYEDISYNPSDSVFGRTPLPALQREEDVGMGESKRLLLSSDSLRSTETYKKKRPDVEV
jgi:hypothetical protein